MRQGRGGVRDGNEFSRITSSVHMLSAVCSGTVELVRVLHYINWYCSGKLLVLIQYNISI